MTERVDDIVDVCLLAGKLMLESGGETYRVEDTMGRIAASFGVSRSHSYVTPTGIMFSVEGTNVTRFIRISERSTDLSKVALVNHISRRISSGELSLDGARKELERVQQQPLGYPLWQQTAAAAAASACFASLLGGMNHFLPSLLSGGMAFWCFEMMHRFVKIRFFAEVFCRFCRRWDRAVDGKGRICRRRRKHDDWLGDAARAGAGDYQCGARFNGRPFDRRFVARC